MYSLPLKHVDALEHSLPQLLTISIPQKLNHRQHLQLKTITNPRQLVSNTVADTSISLEQVHQSMMNIQNDILQEYKETIGNKTVVLKRYFDLLNAIVLSQSTFDILKTLTRHKHITKHSKILYFMVIQQLNNLGLVANQEQSHSNISLNEIADVYIYRVTRLIMKHKDYLVTQDLSGFSDLAQETL